MANHVEDTIFILCAVKLFVQLHVVIKKPLIIQKHRGTYVLVYCVCVINQVFCKKDFGAEI